MAEAWDNLRKNLEEQQLLTYQPNKPYRNIKQAELYEAKYEGILEVTYSNEEKYYFKLDSEDARELQKFFWEETIEKDGWIEQLGAPMDQIAIRNPEDYEDKRAVSIRSDWNYKLAENILKTVHQNHQETP